jgi:beta-galactosidase
MFPYGTQYYRTPNPPQSEWERDFRSMADHGFTIVKIWAMWTWMHVAEDEFDFSHFDRLFELAEANGLKVVVNTILENAPYWMIARHPEAQYLAHDGLRVEPIARPNNPGGAWPGLCLDNVPVRAEAEAFLKAIGARYVDHPALWGYDVWNEVFFEPASHPSMDGRYWCYCEASRARFVEWLKERYGSLEALCEAWRRRYTAWEQVYPPRFWGGYPDWIDWLKCRIAGIKEQMEWRLASLRSVDSQHPMTSHGLASTLTLMPTHLTDDWDIAPLVDQWGLSSFPLWHRSQPADHFMIIDVARSAATAHGKRIWQNEIQGGQSADGLGRSQIPRAHDTRVWNWSAFMSGCKGLMYWCWRPELLGPESPGFGLCKLDGSPSERSQEAATFSRFFNAHPELADADPIPGDIAIVVLPESELFCYVADRSAANYSQAVIGVYRALWERNILVDFVKLDRLSEYPVAYLPFPLMIEREHADALREYVANGGTLVSEACPAHFGDNGYCSFRIPGLGLDEVFGAVEEETDYLPNIGDGPALRWMDSDLPCAVYRERLTATTGTVESTYIDGSVGVIANSFGKGKTRLIGTFPGIGFLHQRSPAAAALITGSLDFAGVRPKVFVSNPEVKVRVHRGPKGDYLYALNVSHESQGAAVVRLADGLGPYRDVEPMAPDGSSIEVAGPNEFALDLPPREGLVVRLVGG